MKWAFLISGVIEICGALVLFVNPAMILGNDIIPISKMYGLAALVLGISNILAYKHFSNQLFFRQFFVLMMGFHGALAMICYQLKPLHFPKYSEGMFLHLTCFLLFLVFYLKEVRPESDKKIAT